MVNFKMIYELKKWVRDKAPVLLLLIVFLYIAGCANFNFFSKKNITNDASITYSEPSNYNDMAIISAIIVSENSIRINANKNLKYTSVKRLIPSLGVELYFPDTRLGNVKDVVIDDNEFIKAVNSTLKTANGYSTKVEITLIKDAVYKVERQQTDLLITFDKKIDNSISKLEAPVSNNFVKEPFNVKKLEKSFSNKDFNVEISPLENNTLVQVHSNISANNYKTSKIERPPKIIFDLFDIDSPDKNMTYKVTQNKYIKEIRTYKYPKRLRLVIDTFEDYLSSYVAFPSEDGISIYIGNDLPDEKKHISEIVNDQKTQEADNALDKKQIISNEVPEIINPEPKLSKIFSQESFTKKLNKITSIDFISEKDASSSVIIKTEGKVDYSIDKSIDKQVVIKLKDAEISKSQEKEMPTQYFETSVNKIRPVKSNSNSVDIVIDLNSVASYYVKQKNNRIIINFDAPSSPLSYKKSISRWNEPKQLKKEEPEKKEIIQTFLSSRKARTKYKYKGEKIALDFYETDIKNVFRILREVSGRNFAIDTDVGGRVTLTLKKPVPWDQILDLILKMNGLGMTYEGDIIRISRKETISKEEAERIAKLEIEKKNSEVLAPLFTEYIPVNYAKASDIEKHIQGLLTKDRGTLSVDDRTNLIIMTDVREKINRALGIKKELDRPNLQVMIEARIVEVTNNFSRDIGIEWSGEVGIQPGDQRSGVGPSRGYDFLGGTYGYNWAVSYPSAASSNIGINFQRLSGLTPFTLNAKLSAMESLGEVRIISAPRIVTLDNKQAIIEQGLEYPINKLDEQGNTVTEFKDVFLKLNVTPHITLDKRISMVIDTSKNDLGPVVNGEQSFQTKQAKTELLVNDGDTVVIGGIMKTRKDSSTSGVPLFSKLPIIGWLFNTNARSTDKEELLIFITPTIINMDETFSLSNKN